MRISDWSPDVCSSDLEAPRLYRYGAPQGRQSMSQTFIPRFLAAGGRLAADVRVHRLQRSNERWRITACHAPKLSPSRNIEISADNVFVACGAIHRLEEQTTELQSLMSNTYDVFCLKNK